MVCPILCQSALACASCAGTTYSAVSAQPEKGGPQSSAERESALPGPDLHRQRSLPLVPDWFVLMHVRTPNPCSLVGANGTVLIGQNGAALID